MDFRTYLEILASDAKIDHTTVTMLFGSCFSTHIGSKLHQHKFQVDINPFGILYNPFSISVAIQRLLQQRHFTEDDLVYHEGMYHSFMHHGQFSSPSKHESLDEINNRFSNAITNLQNADFLLITFGTAYVFWRMESGEVAANCHKIPDSHFHRARLSVNNIVEEWHELIQHLIESRPSLKILFTVSPVRHWKDGARDNQVSKSTLHLAIEELKQRFEEHVLYFPAYELMMDELRDYRFYAEDMLHPTSFAVDYIWERFSNTYFTKTTRDINQSWSKIRKSLEHRPIHPGDQAHQQFLQDTKKKLQVFASNHPHIPCNTELEWLVSQLGS